MFLPDPIDAVKCFKNFLEINFKNYHFLQNSSIISNFKANFCQFRETLC